MDTWRERERLDLEIVKRKKKSVNRIKLLDIIKLFRYGSKIKPTA